MLEDMELPLVFVTGFLAGTLFGLFVEATIRVTARLFVSSR